MTRLLLLGAGGQLGQEIAGRAGEFAMVVEPRTHRDTDIADAAMVGRTLADAKPDIVVNAAAYTRVDQAEVEAEEAFRVNATGPGVLAHACARAGIPLVHLSTDYVFDGTKRVAYVEDDPISPLNVYGASKVAGEEAVRRGCPNHVIVRTSWVFGLYGANFLKTVLKLVAGGDTIRMVADQRGCPTASADLAEAIFAVARRLAAGDAPWGTYHFTGSGATTWYGFACEVVERQARLTGRRPEVMRIAAADYPTRARRPANSQLDSAKFEATFHFRAQPWQQRVDDLVGRMIVEGGT